jgi:hypothetical protein
VKSKDLETALELSVEDLMGDDVPNVMASTETLDAGAKTSSDERRLLEKNLNIDLNQAKAYIKEFGNKKD